MVSSTSVAPTGRLRVNRTSLDTSSPSRSQVQLAMVRPGSWVWEPEPSNCTSSAPVWSKSMISCGV
jgi:hypothetical protein